MNSAAIAYVDEQEQRSGVQHFSRTEYDRNCKFAKPQMKSQGGGRILIVLNRWGLIYPGLCQLGRARHLLSRPSLGPGLLGLIIECIERARPEPPAAAAPATVTATLALGHCT